MNPPQQRIDWQQELPLHRRWLTTVLRARGVAPSDLDEVQQEVEVAAATHADQLRDSRKIAPWLYRIAVTCALQYRRRLGRGRRLLDRYTSERADQLSRTEVDPLDWLLANEQRQLVREAIRSVPSRDAELLLLKYSEDWSYRELADHLGVTTSTIESRLHRAREKMRQAPARLSPEAVSR